MNNWQSRDVQIMAAGKFTDLSFWAMGGAKFQKSLRCCGRLMRSAGCNSLLMALFFSMTPCPLVSQSSNTTPENFKIAFIGDQGLGGNARAVLKLIKLEETDAVVHSGDFDYKGDPEAWDNQINEILGSDFPYFASVGNHDKKAYYGPGGYQEFLEARMKRLGITWDGDLGVKSSFKFKGIYFIFVAPDIFGTDHGTYIREKLAADNSIWTVSSWHKNMRSMQLGRKSDDTGWEVYEESRRGGAIIATGHEHSYARTYLLSSCENQVVAGTSDTLILTKDQPATDMDEGKSFVFVSGLAGRSIRDQERTGEWWASVYTSDQEANYGALFGTFNVNGDPNLATFYFKNIDGVVVDSFTVISQVESSSTGADRRRGSLTPKSFFEE